MNKCCKDCVKKAKKLFQDVSGYFLKITRRYGFFWLSWVVTSSDGLVYDLCWFCNGTTQRLTESGFMEKLGTEPATPGLQDIGLSPTPGRF